MVTGSKPWVFSVKQLMSVCSIDRWPLLSVAAGLMLTALSVMSGGAWQPARCITRPKQLNGTQPTLELCFAAELKVSRSLGVNPLVPLWDEQSQRSWTREAGAAAVLS